MGIHNSYESSQDDSYELGFHIYLGNRNLSVDRAPLTGGSIGLMSMALFCVYNYCLKMCI